MLKSNTIVPLYAQLRDKIRGEIEAGMYRPGDKLPPELEIAKSNDVSLITARKALQDLVAEGLVQKKQGKGTFVALPKYGRDYTRIMSFSESCHNMGTKPGSILLENTVVMPEGKIARQLQLPQGSSAIFISRLRTVDGEPMVIENNHFPMEYAFLLNDSLGGSLFKVLQEKADAYVIKSHKQIEICRATAQEARLLQVQKNEPLLLVRSVAYKENNVPLYYGQQIINGERYTLHV